MQPASVSPRRRREIIDALRRGTVPQQGLDVLAVGLDRFAPAIDGELGRVASGESVFKAIRGEYGSGKTFFTRWLEERGKARGMAAAEVQIAESETPLHRLETVYRRSMESLCTSEFPPSAFRSVVDGWLYTVQDEVLQGEGTEEFDAEAMVRAAEVVLDKRLAVVSRTTPAFAAAIRGYQRAQLAGQEDVAEGLMAWLAGQPHVASEVRRAAGLRGDLDHFGALGFLQGLLILLEDSGHPGLVLVLDEVETAQRIRSDVRDKALNALRQLIDDIDRGRFPGLYLAITGTPAFYDGTQGVQRLPPLAQRLATDFDTDARFDNPRAVQLRLPAFTLDRLTELGGRVRDLYAVDSSSRVREVVDDGYIRDLGVAVAGGLGGRVGIAPRLFVKKLVADVLDRVDQFPDFDPRHHYALTLRGDEMTLVERNAASSPDDVAIDLP